MYTEIADDIYVKVSNRGNAIVTYVIPELRITRTFAKNEEKKIKASELRALAWVPGGRTALKHSLIVHDEMLTQELLGALEPEYYYSNQEVKELLLHGSEDQLRDALEFGYEGTKNLIKDTAVNLKLNDVRKREIILEMTGFNVNNAIAINEQSNVNLEPATKTRRAAPLGENDQTNATSGRRDNPYQIKAQN